MKLHVRTWGDGEPVVLVHGSIMDGEDCWSEQRPLADQGFRLIVPDRRGFGSSPPCNRVDFETDAHDVAELLDPRVHLVGWSYGGVVALLAASQRPEAVKSLVLAEPSAFSVARGHPAIEEFIGGMEKLQTQVADDDNPDRLLEGIPSERGRGARLFLHERPPWEAEIPVEDLAAAAFGKLLITGGRGDLFDVVSVRLAASIGARVAIVESSTHAVQKEGAHFNRTVLKFWLQDLSELI